MTIRSFPTRFATLLLVIGLLAPVIVLINPIREMAVDDDWVYASTVRHLVDTGSYKLAQWADPNMPFQAYWGALFTHALGYSFTSLRISTLVLTFFGLLAFYYLAQEHRLNRVQSALVVLWLFASPLIMRYSFSFNSDVPFLMCVIIAMALYARAIRLKSYALMFLASCCASAAVLTRQFGMALPASVFLLWMLSKQRRVEASLFLTGFLMPAIASLWQLLVSGLAAPTWVQQNSMYRQTLYFGDYPQLLGNIIWRPTVTLHYLAILTLPCMFLSLFAAILEIKQARGGNGTSYFLNRQERRILLALAAYIVFGIVYGRLVNGVSVLMPYLDWDQTLAALSRLQRGGWTLVTSIAAVLYGCIFVRRYFDRKNWTEVRRSERLLDLFTVLFFAEHLVYHKFGDRYLLPLLPLVLITVGHRFRGLVNHHTVAAFTISILMLLVSAIWTRGSLEESEASWKAAESLRASGIERSKIFGTYEWNSYHGSTADYISEMGPVVLDDNSDFWYRWNPERKRRAEFVITTAPAVIDGKVAYEFPYRDMFFRERRVYVVEKREGFRLSMSETAQ